MMMPYKHMTNLAYKIAQERKQPFHYKRMFTVVSQGKQSIGYSPRTRHEEEFRNKLDYNDLRFTRLTNGYFTLTEWIKPHTLLQNYEKTSYQLSLDTRSKAMIEAGNRVPYMKNKHNDDPKTRCEKVLKGKTNELGTIEYFRKKYKPNIETPNNAYNQHDEWDFLFKTDNKIVRFDAKSIGVFNNTERAVYIERYRIHRDWADVFLCVESNGDLTVHGYILKEEIKKAIETNHYFIFKEEVWHDPRFLETYLNHLIYRFDEPTILQNGYLWNGLGGILWKYRLNV